MFMFCLFNNVKDPKYLVMYCPFSIYCVHHFIRRREKNLEIELSRGDNSNIL